MQPRGIDGDWLPCFDPLELTEKEDSARVILLFIHTMFRTI